MQPSNIRPKHTQSKGKPPTYDKAIQSYSALEEKLNALSHLLGWILAIIGTIALVLKSQTLIENVSSVVFGSSMILLFGASTLYHWVDDAHWKAILKRADHIAIYLLIAGSYTPFLLVSLEGWVSTVSIISIWCIALLGVLFKTLFHNQYPKLAIATYAVMGWLALVIIVPIYNALPFMGFALLFLGGLAYSLGIPFYMAKQTQFTHAIWHVFVLLGAGCHFFAIYRYVIA
ncbi:MAG: hemolysin III family protein [Glaciecola sp.]|jgi:hemolysin III|nr:hemolysin III family protein [Glaciecola sp.]MDG1815623.1 hemolysin III family protein [Glaciecola sp.]MDG2098142.1 hemolysin III family protein [Glaciecola sp.]